MKKQSIISYYFKWRNQDDKLPKNIIPKKNFQPSCAIYHILFAKKHRIILNNRKLCGKITKFMIFPQSFVKNIVETRHGTSLQTAY